LIDKRTGDLKSKVERETRKEVSAELEAVFDQRVSEEAARLVDDAVQRAVQETEVRLRRELAEEVFSPSGGGVSGSPAPARDPSRVHRPYTASRR
jgi:hypothetical protein